ncbi:MAG: Dps family protein [Bacteroidota bacterium]
MKANIGISEEHSNSIAKKLNTLLADEHILYVKTRNFHWNVTGPNFSSLHLMFEGQYTATALNIDLIAERIRTVGYPAAGSMKEFLALSNLNEAEGKHKADDMVRGLLADHESIATSLRSFIEECDGFGDEATVDLLTGLLEQHEKTAWMLRSYLE